jgi:hypothetical protein
MGLWKSVASPSDEMSRSGVREWRDAGRRNTPERSIDWRRDSMVKIMAISKTDAAFFARMAEMEARLAGEAAAADDAAMHRRWARHFEWRAHVAESRSPPASAVNSGAA